jgi:hypothetical protein
VMEVYGSATSVDAGATIEFHGSCGEPGMGPDSVAFTVGVARVGAPSFSDAGSGMAPAAPRFPDRFYERGCSWPVIYRLAVPLMARSGAYSAQFRAEDGSAATVSFVVKAAAMPAARILVVFPTATAQAYNGWGGWSLYDFPESGIRRSPRISFDRPGDWSAAQDSGAFVRWLERFVPPVDYGSSIDLHRDAEFVSRYDVVVSVGHDEYWSAEMRDHVEAFVADGGSACFLSGNTCWWQVRFEDDERTIVCYKDAGADPITQLDPAQATTNWYRDPPGRPENTLTGVSFRHGGLTGTRPLPDSAFAVRDASHWVFGGTGLEAGNAFGGKVITAGLGAGGEVAGLVHDQVVGYECDGALFRDFDGELVATGEDGSPSDLKILGVASLQAARAAVTLTSSEGAWAVSLLARQAGAAGTHITASVRQSPGNADEDELVLEAPDQATETLRYARADIASLVEHVNQHSALVSALLLAAGQPLHYTPAKPLQGFGQPDGFPIGHATMAILERPSTGTVFTAATTDWAGRLAPEHDWDAIAQITRNLLRRLTAVTIAPGAPVTALSRYPSGKALDLWVTANDGRVYSAFYNDDGTPWTGWFQIAADRAGGSP